MTIMTQNEQVLEILKNQTLTSMQAIKKLGCLRLASRINELRDMGYPIETIMIKKNGKRYAQYKLNK